MAIRRIYAADPMAAMPGGKAMLESAVNELAWAAVLRGVDTEPTRPKIVWVDASPREWRGRKLPGARWAVDNPDNVYRVAPIDGTSKYEINVRRHGAGPVQFSFLIYSHWVGEDGHQNQVDAPLGGLRSDEVKWNPDGSFTLTIDAEPANGRPNHIQSTPDSVQLLIRNTLGDWTTQLPLEMSIKRVGGPPAETPASDSELARRAAKLMQAAAELSLNWKKKSLFGRWQDNLLCQPFGRGMHWGFGASGNFNLADDEALVVTVDPMDAHYIGFSVVSLWLASLSDVGKFGSLNGQQSWRNPDGTYTYVIAAQDPGFYNWLDTGGLNQGGMFYRWQSLPDSRTSAEGAIRSVKLVKFQDLKRVLPSDAKFINAAERGTIRKQRAADYARRYVSAE
ncbi:MAG: DUF1214 domain-containing protein [Vicinamibacterales bacterium]